MVSHARWPGLLDKATFGAIALASSSTHFNGYAKTTWPPCPRTRTEPSHCYHSAMLEPSRVPNSAANRLDVSIIGICMMQREIVAALANALDDSSLIGTIARATRQANHLAIFSSFHYKIKTHQELGYSMRVVLTHCWAQCRCSSTV